MITVPVQVVTSNRLDYFDAFGASIAAGESRFAPIADALADTAPTTDSVRTANRPSFDSSAAPKAEVTGTRTIIDSSQDEVLPSKGSSSSNSNEIQFDFGAPSE